jgi:hypothetical protein
MATVTRTCLQCKRQFRVPNESRRKYCEQCHPPKVGPGTIIGEDGQPIQVDSIPLARLAAVTKPGDGPAERVVRAELDAIGRADSVPGALALRLARQLDVEPTTGSQAAALSRQIQQHVDRAREGVAPEKDWLDELASRRLAKTESVTGA